MFVSLRLDHPGEQVPGIFVQGASHPECVIDLICITCLDVCFDLLDRVVIVFP